MVEFYIANTDITQFIDIQNYDINRVDVYESWKDGNRREHRNATRTRIEGGFQAGFTNETERGQFLTLLASARQPNGYYNVTSSVNNMSATATYEAFINATAAGKYDELNGREWIVFDVTVEER